MLIELGALAPPLAEQVPGLPKTKAEILQRRANAIVLLYVGGILTETEKRNAHKRLIKQIKNERDGQC